MKRKLIKYLLITVCILTAGTVYADANHYTSYVEVGYGYKVAGAFRDFASGTQKVILKDTMVYSAPTQPIKVELVQKGFLSNTKLGEKNITLSTNNVYTLDYGYQKSSAKRQYVFYNNLPSSSGASVTGIYIGIIEMYPRR